MNNTRSSSADLALQDTAALAAAEYGRLAVWVHSPPFSGLGAASIAAGRCISASSSFLILASVCHAYPVFVRTPSSFFPKIAKSVRSFRFRFKV